MLLFILRLLFGVKKQTRHTLPEIRSVLVVRQQNQLGDQLAITPLLRAVKNHFPQCKLTFICSPENAIALKGNTDIDTLFVFDKKQLFDFGYLTSLYKTLRSCYSMVLAPATVSLSFTNNVLAGIANSRCKVGPNSLNGVENETAFLFHHRIDLDWRANPETHITQRSQGLLIPFGIVNKSTQLIITPSEAQKNEAKQIIAKWTQTNGVPLIGLHIGAGKPPNRWPVENFIAVAESLQEQTNALVYLTGSSADLPIIEQFEQLAKKSFPKVFNQPIPVLAEIISRSDLFITNDTGVMHIAAATTTKQVSLFGPTEYEVWAPQGNGKIAVANGEAITSITVQEVLDLALQLLH